MREVDCFVNHPSLKDASSLCIFCELFPSPPCNLNQWGIYQHIILCFIKRFCLLIGTFRKVYKNADKLNIPNIDWTWNFKGEIFLKRKDTFWINVSILWLHSPPITNYIVFADYLIRIVLIVIPLLNFSIASLWYLQNGTHAY